MRAKYPSLKEGTMLALVIVGVVGLLVGFGAGRVKNAKKLAAVNAEFKAVEGKITYDANAVLAKIKAKL